METGVMPLLATAIRGWFPFLKNRAVAVSDATVTKDNVPSLPVCFVVLIRETGAGSTMRSRTEAVDEIAVVFLLKSETYPMGDGKQSPFWAYYDFETLRNKLVGEIKRWEAPNGTRLAYRGLDIESTAFATEITFRFDYSSEVCDLPDEDGDGGPVMIDFTITPAPAPFCEDCDTKPETEDCKPCL